MKRIAAVFAVTILVWVGVAVGSAAAAAAYPSTPFGRYEIPGGATAGSITWYDRSVGVQGYVVDSAVQAGSTTVVFDFWQGSTFLSTETRTASGETTSFNFSEPGPVGGIRSVIITLCNGLNCPPGHEILRP